MNLTKPSRLDLEGEIDRFILLNIKHPEHVEYLRTYKKELIGLFRDYSEFFSLNEIQQSLYEIATKDWSWDNAHIEHYSHPPRFEEKVQRLFAKLGKSKAINMAKGKSWKFRALICNTYDSAFFNVLEVFSDKLPVLVSSAWNGFVLAGSINSFRDKSLEDTLYIRGLLEEDKSESKRMLESFPLSLGGGTRVDIVKYLKEKGYVLSPWSYIRFTSWSNDIDFILFKRLFEIFVKNSGKKEIKTLINSKPRSSGYFFRYAGKTENPEAVFDLFSDVNMGVIKSMGEYKDSEWISPYGTDQYVKVLGGMSIERLKAIRKFIEETDLVDKLKESQESPWESKNSHYNVMRALSKIHDYEKFWFTARLFGEQDFKEALKINPVSTLCTVIGYIGKGEEAEKDISKYGAKGILLNRTEDKEFNRRLDKRRYEIVYGANGGSLLEAYKTGLPYFKEQFPSASSIDKEKIIGWIIKLDPKEHNEGIDRWLEGNKDYMRIIEKVGVLGVGGNGNITI